jgi:acyl-CoA reductase-like NAD-dependent aldehyde dehydrogenase
LISYRLYYFTGTRTFVHESIYDEFVAKSVELAKNRIIGDPFSEDTQHGPQINEQQMNKILGMIEKGVKEGAKLMIGGMRIGNTGFYVEPTVFADVTDDMTIAREEIFGPVQSILKFSTLEEVIERCNSSKYGLGAGILTNDINKAFTFAQSVQAGSVWINCYDANTTQTPFGGYKMSGFGREL